MKTSKITRVLALICLSALGFAFIGCEGDQGPAGTPGLNPDSPPIITAVVAAPDSIGTGESTVLFVAAYDPNGDPMTYQWTAAHGTLASTNAAVTNWTAPNEMDIYEITVTVTDPDGQATRTVTVGVNVYLPSVFPSYLGDNANRCGHCHEAIVEGYEGTHHAEGWATLVEDNATTNQYCVQCHVTGYDNLVDFNGNVTHTGLDNGGYDQNPIPQLQNVQCEACHGPMGPSFASHNPDVRAAMRGETCDRCHTQNEEYMVSGHGTAIERAGGYEGFVDEFGHSATCVVCHTSEGFIALHDADYAGAAMAEEPWQVTCATCHNVHAQENESYLRGLEAFPIIYGGEEFPDGFEISDWGKGQLCGQCHHARRDSTNIANQINNGTSRPGPHESPQADMLAGYGSYEIPSMTYERESAHQPDVVIGESSLENMCVKCHIYVIPFGEPGGPIHGHHFAPDVRACNTCHATPDNFDYRGRRTEIDGLMAQLNTMLPHDSLGNITFNRTLSTREQREAGYAWYFVNNEGSHGVHNFTYARSLLTNAIDYLDGMACSDPRDEKTQR